MKTIFDTCTPRDEVLRGELKEDIFAARLRDVLDGKADPIYGDPQTFFDNTYPTAGLKTLLNDALGRLTGDASGVNAIIRLETAFGGGKTHNLIALYHVAGGHAPASHMTGFLDDISRLPAPGDIKIAGVVGSDLDPTVGVYHPADGTKTYTLWGELAYQLGGPAAYAQVAESEKLRAAIGTDLFERFVGDRPTLIMIDEIARHLRAAMAVPTATGKSNLADQTVAFLMSLLEFASSKQRCLVVLTLAGESDAFAAETELLRKKLAETLQISARQERVLTPTTGGEVYAIVTHRLFRSVDCEAAKETYRAYTAYLKALADKGADLPQRCLRAEYVQDMTAAYPFHPELLLVLSQKTATIPNFNQTRGALRLLAWTVRRLWDERPADAWLIHPYHLDLAQPQIAEDLTSRLDRPKFRQVIEADIASPLLGTSSHAQELDGPLVEAQRPPYARRLATTIFLHSLTQGIASGVDPADLLLATVQPDGQGGGDEPAVVGKTLERLADKAWFLEYDGHRYRFKTEPSINKIIADETVQVGPSKAKVEIEGRIRQIWNNTFAKTAMNRL
jgi:predicted AAA+ superfamily ATPase